MVENDFKKLTNTYKTKESINRQFTKTYDNNMMPMVMFSWIITVLKWVKKHGLVSSSNDKIFEKQLFKTQNKKSKGLLRLKYEETNIMVKLRIKR